jgi:hypothetical protein
MQTLMQAWPTWAARLRLKASTDRPQPLNKFTMANIKITAHTPRGTFVGNFSSEAIASEERAMEVRDVLQGAPLSWLVLHGQTDGGEPLEISFRGEVLSQSVLCFQLIND